MRARAIEIVVITIAILLISTVLFIDPIVILILSNQYSISPWSTSCISSCTSADSGGKKKPTDKYPPQQMVRHY